MGAGWAFVPVLVHAAYKAFDCILTALLQPIPPFICLHTAQPTTLCEEVDLLSIALPLVFLALATLSYKKHQIYHLKSFETIQGFQYHSASKCDKFRAYKTIASVFMNLMQLNEKSFTSIFCNDKSKKDAIVCSKMFCSYAWRILLTLGWFMVCCT